MSRLDELLDRLGKGDCRLTEGMLQDIVSGSRAALGEKLRSVVLYGSYARGDNTRESDVDVALFVEGEISGEEERTMIHCFSDLCMEYNMVFSPNDIEQERYDRFVSLMPYYQNIRNEGIVLWAA